MTYLAGPTHRLIRSEPFLFVDNVKQGLVRGEALAVFDALSEYGICHINMRQAVRDSRAGGRPA
jgi:hypothetical protein